MKFDPREIRSGIMKDIRHIKPDAEIQAMDDAKLIKAFRASIIEQAMIEAELLTRYMKHIEEERKNKPVTRVVLESRKPEKLKRVGERSYKKKRQDMLNLFFEFQKFLQEQGEK